MALNGGMSRRDSEGKHMTTKEIRVANLEDVKCIVHAAARCPHDVEAVDAKGRVADASSILGMLNLDYKQPVSLRSSNERAVESIYQKLTAKS